ncbi:hypothetical protein ACJIZ3_021592 [Penstemon smallii]|uniref:Transmembrane protein n=1 Tax=Penstemon smallii TaxID=265156 RepID=A0ABD3SM16_9LAMI
MGGGMETNKNRWIEDWGAARENLEHNFRWTRRNFALVGIFGIAIPVLVYKGIVREFHCGHDTDYRKSLFQIEASKSTFQVVVNKFFSWPPIYALLRVQFFDS